MSETNEIIGAGAFHDSLNRNSSKIRKDRAQNIYDDTKLVYRRQVEDLQLALTRLKREQDAALDLAPSDILSTVPASKDFDPVVFTDRDLEIGVKIRNLEIKLEIAQARYEFLFGEPVAKV